MGNGPSSDIGRHAGAVAWLGAQAREPAERYAAATGRRAAEVRSVQHLRALKPEVLVTLHGRIDRALLDVLYARPAAGLCAPGLLCASDESALANLLEARAAWLRAPLPTGMPVVLRDLFQDSQPPFSQAVAAEAGVMVVRTHSDGVAAHLASRRLLCVAASADRPAPGPGAPACMYSGECVRLGSSVSSAVAEGLLCPPSDIRCHVLVWRACFGLIDPGDAVEQGWSLGLALASSSLIGATALAPGLLIEDPGTTLEDDIILRELGRGACLGAAVLAANRSPWMRRFGQYFILAGDPRMRTHEPRDPDLRTEEAPAAKTSMPRSTSRRVVRDAGATPRDRRRVNDLMLVAAMAEARRPDRLESIVALTELYRLMGPSSEVPGEDGPPASSRGSIQSVMARVMLSTGRIAFEWQSLTGNIQVSRTSCPICRRPSSSYLGTFHCIRAGRRRALVCPACQLVRDGPEGMDLAMVWSRGVFEIRGQAPPPGWVGRLCVWAGKTWNGRTVDWPVLPGGRLAGTCEIDLGARRGVHLAHLVLVSPRLRVAVLSCRVSLACAMTGAVPTP